MSTIFRRIKGEQDHDDERRTTLEMFGEGVGRCTVCDGDATGWWRGQTGDVSLCPRCAVDAMPKLLADSLVGEFDSPHVVQRLQGSLKEFNAQFWRAAAIAIVRVAKARPGVPDLPQVLNGRPHR
jgi:hypothetical protein